MDAILFKEALEISKSMKIEIRKKLVEINDNKLSLKVEGMILAGSDNPYRALFAFESNKREAIKDVATMLDNYYSMLDLIALMQRSSL